MIRLHTIAPMGDVLLLFHYTSTIIARIIVSNSFSSNKLPSFPNKTQTREEIRRTSFDRLVCSQDELVGEVLRSIVL